MTTRRGIAVIVGGTIAAASGCTILLGENKDFHPIGGTGGTGGATAASSSAGTAGGTGGAGGAGSAASSVSSTGTTTAATTASVAASTSAAASTAASSSGSVGDAGCATDDDHDTYLSWTCDTDPATQDCADEDARAHPGAGFASMPITGTVKPGTLPYDFDCDGSETPETPVVTCGLGCSQSIMGFQSTVACGDSAPLGACGSLCSAWTALSPVQIQVQRCK